MPGEHEIRVRGRDFKAYRIGGAIVAVLFAAALVWQAIYVLQGHNLVVPEVAWSSVGTAQTGVSGTDSSGTLASETLTQRTQLQRERYVSGPAPGEPPPPQAVGREERLVAEPITGDAGAFPRAWSIPGEDTLPMLRQRERVSGYTAVPYPNADVFERPEGRTWRVGIADYAPHIGALAILGAIALLALVLAVRGRVPIAMGRDGRTVERFAFVERATHWMTSGSFVVLALTGIVLAFGTTLIGPIFGEAALGEIGWISAWAHMIFFPSFLLGILAMAVMWLWRNLPEPRLDLPWLAQLGGMASDDPDNPPARKFNAGQKVTFWVALLGGLAMSATGVTLMFPYVWLGISGMAWVMLVHSVMGLLMIAFFIGHAYIGTVGMQDAIHAMWSGRVDLNWAREHHELWLDELARKGELPPDVHRPGPDPAYRTPPVGAGTGAGPIMSGRKREV